MELTEDFYSLQGLFTVIHASTGDFTSIRYSNDGNEVKVTKIIEDLKKWLNKKKYIRDGMINYKREMSIRKLVLLLILNTELKTKSCFDTRVSHLIGFLPQFSTFLLTAVIFELSLYEFYAEAITCLPVEISLELLECYNKHPATGDPYLLLKQTSVFAQSVYFKIYHMRYEHNDKLNNLSVKLLDKFMNIPKNYINPVTDKLLDWPKVKMYQYVGKAIYELLNLFKTCFSTCQIKEFVIPYYQFYQFKTEASLIDSPLTLNKSQEILTECNKHLISLCEGNITAVSVDVYCSWVECKQNNQTLQQEIGNLSYEVLQLLKLIEDPGDLPQMLSSIAINPQPIEDVIKAADERTLLENVRLENTNQSKWLKAFINYGVLNSDECFNTFKSVVNIADREDLIHLLSLNNIKTEYNLKEVLLGHLNGLTATDLIQIVAGFYSKHGLINTNNYESENFNESLQEFFNKLKVGDDIPLKEVGFYVLQNPSKFVKHVIDEAEKNVEHLQDLIQICNFIRDVCNIRINDSNTILSDCIIQETILSNCIIQKLEELDDTRKETCMIQFLFELVQNNLLQKDMADLLQNNFEFELKHDNYQKATLFCKCCKALTQLIQEQSLISVLMEFEIAIMNIRWDIFTYSQEKCALITEIIKLIYQIKSRLTPQLYEALIDATDSYENDFNSFHLLGNDSTEFLTYVNPEYNKNGDCNEQVCQLLKLLPCCVPLEWDLTAKYLIKDNEPLIVLQIFFDLLLVLSEMSKKSSDNYSTLSYCFQQFCVITKIIKENIDTHEEDNKTFIKNICTLIKHLPNELYNIEISLINLFDSNVLKTLKNDEDFLLTLVAMSELDICKMICSKIAA